LAKLSGSPIPRLSPRLFSSEADRRTGIAMAYSTNPLGPDKVDLNCRPRDIPQTKAEQKDTMEYQSIGKQPSPAPKLTMRQRFPADRYPCRKLVEIENVTGIYPTKSII
jgi:hypothetical protein